LAAPFAKVQSEDRLTVSNVMVALDESKQTDTFRRTKAGP